MKSKTILNGSIGSEIELDKNVLSNRETENGLNKKTLF